MIASFDRAQWERQVRRIFGKTADEILAIEEKTHKNDPAAHRVRLEKIITHWEKIRAILQTLPDRAAVERWMTEAGMPKTPADLALTLQDAADAWTGSRDARGKYLLSSMLWDMGLQEEIAEEIRSGRIG